MSEADAGAEGWRLDWPVSAGVRVGSAHLKTVPDDFRVSEVLEAFPEHTEQSGISSVAGEGEHLCLRLEKTGDNTEFVAGELATLAGCRPFDVGFCGLKDRHAVTSQWFSLYRPGMMEDDSALIEQVSARWPVKSACRSVRKLRRGDHQGNHFTIRLRQISADREAVECALERLKIQGAPNYFGPQRFGFGGANLDRAVHIDPAALNRRGGQGKGRRRGRGSSRSGGGRDDRKNVLYFSAARSWLFNEVLASRVADASWRTPLPGEPTETATGPMWGDGGTVASGEAGQRERDIVAQAPKLASLFMMTRMKPERRPLVAEAEGLSWSWLDDGGLELEFFLQPGQYATTILSDIFELEDISLDHHKN
ncbi:tRNA pseudouridine(13) synthase TruD [Marinobacter sp. 1_MG-2023]|uniref:tRNA pseudouridine(13) synthase TruD n=1 Tax=Marinobacter sp. 1_MG-2023 TaxID=3062627 RepID=UPI0026E24102|nr:tRNA pseudouridine(13) synthase TruD [Marinobacter sp. 1_MG-2023]MDO6825644.1 tRNA pseudouridine(13) synthase TruD [Marinobacter sp. 1_MG-2023]